MHHWKSLPSTVQVVKPKVILLATGMRQDMYAKFLDWNN